MCGQLIGLARVTRMIDGSLSFQNVSLLDK